MDKILYLDLETTGLHYLLHSIVQIAGILEVDGKEVDRFNFLIRPHQKLKIDKKALESIKKTKEDLAAHPLSQQEGFKALRDRLNTYVDRFNRADKIRLCGYNAAKFDANFLSRFFELNRDPYYGSYFYPEVLDSMIFASAYLWPTRRKSLPDFTQASVAKELNLQLDVDRLHDAEYDVELARDIYKITSGVKLEELW